MIAVRILLSSLFVALAGCADTPSQTMTIGGKSAVGLVLYTATGAKTKRVDFPPGYYYPGQSPYMYADQRPWLVFEPHAPVTAKGWFGTSEQTRGGIKINGDPFAAEPIFFWQLRGKILREPAPANFHYRFVRREDVGGNERPGRSSERVEDR